MRLHELVLNNELYEKFLSSVPKEYYRIGNFLIDKIPPQWVERLVMTYGNKVSKALKNFTNFIEYLSKLQNDGGVIYGLALNGSISNTYYADYLNALAYMDKLWDENLRTKKSEFKNIELLRIKINPNSLDVVPTLRKFISKPERKILFLTQTGEVIEKRQLNTF